MADQIENYPFPAGPRGCPAHQYAARRENDPLGTVRLPSGDLSGLAVRHADALMVFGDSRFTRELTYQGAPRIYPGFDVSTDPDSMINMDPPRHSRLRRLMSGAFTPRRIEAWRPRVRTLAHELVDGLPEEFDFVTAFAFPLPVQVICEVMGVDGIDTERVRDWTDAFVTSSGRTVDERIHAALEFAGYIAELIAAHRDDPGDGVLAALITAHDEGDRLSDEELVRNTLGLFLAGHETTGTVLTRSMLRLLAPRDGWERLAAEPAVIPNAVEELLRSEAPGEGSMIRVATEDVALPSGVIRKGEPVIASFIGANHDPEVFPDPFTLTLDRENAAGHLSFGRGAHFCLGASLARMELQEALGVLTERLPGLRLAEEADKVVWSGELVYRPGSLLLRR
ncbi:cytochrome P450 [Nonomuraea sp. NPDC046570]|uniref:cytochrome P450 n=1 Tax=Nonomuraea sp. NPDC046570 TaxID=3155255 RepID=UPI00340DD1EC